MGKIVKYGKWRVKRMENRSREQRDSKNHRTHRTQKPQRCRAVGSLSARPFLWVQSRQQTERLNTEALLVESPGVYTHCVFIGIV